jgi:hypothetical protein
MPRILLAAILISFVSSSQAFATVDDDPLAPLLRKQAQELATTAPAAPLRNGDRDFLTALS